MQQPRPVRCFRVVMDSSAQPVCAPPGHRSAERLLRLQTVLRQKLSVAMSLTQPALVPSPLISAASGLGLQRERGEQKAVLTLDRVAAAEPLEQRQPSTRQKLNLPPFRPTRLQDQQRGRVIAHTHHSSKHIAASSTGAFVIAGCRRSQKEGGRMGLELTHGSLRLSETV